MEIPNAPIDEWVNDLKAYQADSIRALLANHSPEETMKLWLSSEGPGGTIKFGGTGQSSEPFLDKLKEEFRKFICGDAAYEKYRQQLSGEGAFTKVAFVSVVSSALGATFGYAATFLAPVVAIMLHSVGAMGINAWCASE